VDGAAVGSRPPLIHGAEDHLRRSLERNCPPVGSNPPSILRKITNSTTPEARVASVSGVTATDAEKTRAAQPLPLNRPSWADGGDSCNPHRPRRDLQPPNEQKPAVFHLVQGGPRTEAYLFQAVSGWRGSAAGTLGTFLEVDGAERGHPDNRRSIRPRHQSPGPAESDEPLRLSVRPLWSDLLAHTSCRGYLPAQDGRCQIREMPGLWRPLMGYASAKNVAISHRSRPALGRGHR
jgi:hypothetical protein